MNAYYDKYPKFQVSVDIVIFGYNKGHLKILIHKRPYNPGEGENSLIGGFVEKYESIDEAAQRVLTEFTGIENIFMRQLGAFGEVNRDPGERVVSIVYFALSDVEKYEAEHTLHPAQWVDYVQLPPLCFDHQDMVTLALQKMRELIFLEPIAAHLLPQYFTLTQMQVLYETIFGNNIDKRNFRRCMTEREFLLKTNMIDKQSSKRGALLFQFKNTTI